MPSALPGAVRYFEKQRGVMKARAVVLAIAGVLLVLLRIADTPLALACAVLG